MTGEMTREERRAKQAKQRARKDALRRSMLGSMPQNGICVEVGVWRGEFSQILLEELTPSHLYLIDPWAVQNDAAGGASLAGGRDKNNMDDIHDQVASRFAKEISAGRVTMVRDFSAPAFSAFDDGEIDFIYLDGDHSFEGVLSDLEALLPKLRKGGVVMLDDYHQKGWWGDGVIRALNTFVGRHPDAFRFKSIQGAQVAVQKIAD